MKGFKWDLMGHFRGNIEDIGFKPYFKSGDLTQHVSEEKNFSIFPRDHSYDMLLKNMATFFSCKVCLRLR